MSENKLLEVRLSKGFSQEELAELIGMDQSSYSRREKGLKKISDTEWTKIAKELGVKKEDLYETSNQSTKVNNSANVYSFNLPNFIIEYIESLKNENTALREKLKKIESKKIESKKF
ncbi:helix-turn-helix transcriptional regulator [Flavobacterium sp. ZB4R12]|uniref:helix-turn-helix transcriptional regulator n=1 Tax=Flavobacterium sp. ZB4R12 TaxID=3398732 RepID=UPI003AAF37FE